MYKRKQDKIAQKIRAAMGEDVELKYNEDGKIMIPKEMFLNASLGIDRLVSFNYLNSSNLMMPLIFIS